MKYLVIILYILFILSESTIVFSQDGQNIFRQNCAVCHRIGQGKLVGPDLLNIHKEREPVWLETFIRSSQSMIKDGDELAVQIYDEYNRIIMPDFKHLSDDDMKSLLAYIEISSDQFESTSVTTMSQPLSDGKDIIPGSSITGTGSIETIYEMHQSTFESFNKFVIIIMFLLSMLLALLILMVIKNFKG